MSFTLPGRQGNVFWKKEGLIVTLLVVLNILWTIKAELNPNIVIEKEILDGLFKSYDRRVRPGSGRLGNVSENDPAIVTVNMYLRSISKIDDVSMEYSVQLTFREEWNDERLKFDNRGTIEYINLQSMENIWQPDLFFSNEKSGHFHDMLVRNLLLRVYPNGNILFSVRISLMLSCPMSLEYYPLDRQRCYIEMISYAYTTRDIIFVWKELSPIQIIKNLHLPSFSLERTHTSYCTSKTNTGEYSCLRVELLLRREFSYYLLQLYIPSFMLVIVSWVSFWLDKDAVPARVSLGVTTLLTMATQSSGINAKLPPVSYTKAIDIWIGSCLTFIFGALLEFALVNYVARKEAILNKKMANGTVTAGDASKKGLTNSMTTNPGIAKFDKKSLNSSSYFDSYGANGSSNVLINKGADHANNNMHLASNGGFGYFQHMIEDDFNQEDGRTRFGGEANEQTLRAGAFCDCGAPLTKDELERERLLLYEEDGYNGRVDGYAENTGFLQSHQSHNNNNNPPSYYNDSITHTNQNDSSSNNGAGNLMCRRDHHLNRINGNGDIDLNNTPEIRSGGGTLLSPLKNEKLYFNDYTGPANEVSFMLPRVKEGGEGIEENLKRHHSSSSLRSKRNNTKRMNKSKSVIGGASAYSSTIELNSRKRTGTFNNNIPTTNPNTWKITVSEGEPKKSSDGNGNYFPTVDGNGDINHDFNNNDQPPVKRKKKGCCHSFMKKYKSRAKRIDVLSRIFFPLAFTGFNIVYWSAYMM